MSETLQSAAETSVIEQKEGIKLTRNSKGYGYEVKILSLDVKSLKKITDEIEEAYKIKRMEE